MNAIHISPNNFNKFDISKIDKGCLGFYFRTYNTEEELLLAKKTLPRLHTNRYLYYVEINTEGLINSRDKVDPKIWKNLCINSGINEEKIADIYTNNNYNLGGNAFSGLIGIIHEYLININKSSKQIFDVFIKSGINGIIYNEPENGFPGQVQIFNPSSIKILNITDIKNDTFSISNLTLKRYLIKLLRYNQENSDSYNTIKNRVDDPFVMSLIGDQKFESLKGIERENYLNKLMADVRYLGNDTLKHISYVARNLRYEEKLEDTMNKKELFSELRKVCADSKNPNSRKLFNELVKSFNCPMCDSTPGGGGASLSMSGVMEQGAKVEDKLDDQLDERLEKHSTFALSVGEILDELIFGNQGGIDKIIKNVSNKLSVSQKVAKTLVRSIIEEKSLDSDWGNFGSIESENGISNISDEEKKNLLVAIDNVKIRDTFAENKIKSLADFKEWLHNFMENVHGSNYNKQVTEKVADDLNKKYNSDFGAMIGAAKSFLHMKDEE